MDLPPSNNTIHSHVMVEPDWISSSVNCSTVAGHFERKFLRIPPFPIKRLCVFFLSIFLGYSPLGDQYQFTCPGNRATNSSSVILEKEITTTGDHNCSF